MMERVMEYKKVFVRYEHNEWKQKQGRPGLKVDKTTTPYPLVVVEPSSSCHGMEFMFASFTISISISISISIYLVH
jgi:hypothetical protein